MNSHVSPRFALIPALILSSLPLSAQENNSIFRLPLQPVTASKRGVVFKAPAAREFGRQCSRQSPTGWWSSVPPSKAEIQALEAALPGWIRAHQLKNWKASFEVFRYQYGALVRGKKRLIYINAIPADDDFGSKEQLWRRSPLIVCDGGTGFWGLEFDVMTKRFQNVDFNGPA
ncbi:hypothetical protein IAD21_05172 [Abditibacteriota bacterium]|nr:hypothetical protein IAD21_05172 [Abditibacteriota bacterium]